MSNAKQIVLAVYPNAYALKGRVTGKWSIWTSRSARKRMGLFCESEESAWISAVSRLPSLSEDGKDGKVDQVPDAGKVMAEEQTWEKETFGQYGELLPKALVADGPAEGIATEKEMVRPLTVPCPTCWSKPFYSCIGLDTQKPIPFFHRDRVADSLPVEPAAPVVADMEFTPSSGNVFADLGFENAEELKEQAYKASQPTPVVVPETATTEKMNDPKPLCKCGHTFFMHDGGGLEGCNESNGKDFCECMGYEPEKAPVVVRPEDDEDNFTTAARFAGITFSQGCQFHLMMQHLLGKAPAPGFLLSAQPAPLPSDQKETK